MQMFCICSRVSRDLLIFKSLRLLQNHLLCVGNWHNNLNAPITEQAVLNAEVPTLPQRQHF